MVCSRRFSRRLGSVVLLAGLMAALPGCHGGARGPDEDDADEGSDLAGEVHVDGSSTVYPISEAVATAFREEYPRVGISVGGQGSGTGFDKLVHVETDIAAASRVIKWSEFQTAQDNGAAFIELPIAYDGLTVVVHPENNWVRQLTVEQLRRIFTQKEAAATWSEVDPSWPDRPIQLFAPGTKSGTYEYFTEVMDGPLRDDMTLSENDNVLVQGVTGEEYAIGFFGASYYFNNRDKLRAVPIVNPSTGAAVLPEAETIESGRYAPLSRPLFLYVLLESLDRLEVQRFMRFYLDHVAAMAQETYYVPLSETLYQRVRRHYDDRLTGTHFWTDDGHRRDGPLAEVYTRDHLLTMDHRPLRDE